MACAGCSVKSKDGTPVGCRSNGSCSTGGCNRLNTYDWLSTMDIQDVESYNIIEVTFKTGGSQFKDEVEPVYRHTAKKMNLYKNKQVYCLFIAPQIDLNLLNSFQRNYYDSQNYEYTGNIIPMTLEQFTRIFLELFHKKKTLTPLIFKDIFDKILLQKIEKKPKEWQVYINNTIEEKILER